MLILIIQLLFVFILILLILSSIVNPLLPKCMCDIMGWHIKPEHIGSDGCSEEGICPRCGRHVLKDSQGNWF